MSDDTINDVELTQVDWSYPIDGSGGDQPRRFDNPLVKGLVVLLMLAVAATVLVATDDDEGSVVASGTIESESSASEPAGPATSVQGVASEMASSGADDPATEDGAEPWIDDASSFRQSVAAEQLRHAGLRDKATTTAPPTTAAPTTKAPTTKPPTTKAPTTAAPVTEASTSETSSEQAETTVAADGDGTGSTDSTTAGQSTTTTAPETTTTAPAETTTTVASGNGWVDTGNGVLVPPVLLAIRWCESTDNYQAANPSSSARGAYQFLSGSWRAYGHADRYGVSTADQASRAQQDEAALLTWERDGTRPWNASKSCWSGRI